MKKKNEMKMEWAKLNEVKLKETQLTHTTKTLINVHKKKQL